MTQTKQNFNEKEESKQGQLVPVEDIDDTKSEGWRPRKYYKYKEDELLDQVGFYEQEMNDMFRYSTEMEDLMKGTDLKAVEGLIDVTKEGMTQHFDAYDKLKDQLLLIDK